MATWLPRSIALLVLVPLFAPVVIAGSDDAAIARLVKQLGSDEFEQREAATEALQKIGKAARTALRKANTESGDAEVRRRSATLLHAIQDSLIRSIDLRPYVNQKLNARFHNHQQGNDLAALPTGKQNFGGVRFTIGGGVVLLGSGMPEKVTGIKVGAKAAKLHFLHACGSCGGVPANAAVGKYVVHYDDKRMQEVEIVYGKDVVDWWVQPGVANPTRSKIAWEGQNRFSAVKLFVTTWVNPNPDRQIVTLDYVMTRAAPFCVAITAEE